MKHVSKGVYKRESIMFYFDAEKEKIMDKVNFCNKCQLERINNRAEASYVCINCDFVFFPIVNYRDIPSGRIYQYSYKRINHLKVGWGLYYRTDTTTLTNIMEILRIIS